MGALRSFFVLGANCTQFLFFGGFMKKDVRRITHAAIIAAAYVVLTSLQYALLPETVSGMIQFRASEALCVLAFFTPAAIPGLGIGCFLFNITSSAVLPFDFLVGSLASLLAAWSMWKTRSCTVKGFPLLGMLFPALTNGILVGAELAICIGGGFWLNAIYVAIGEVAVLLTLGSVLYATLGRKELQSQLFDRP